MNIFKRMFWLAPAGFALFAVSGWLRLAYSALNWEWLRFAGVQPGPLYISITGGLWGLVGTAAVFWLLLHRPCYRLVGLGAALFIALTFWLDRLLMNRAPGSQDNLLFAGLATAGCLLVVAQILYPAGVLRSIRGGCAQQ